MRRFLNRQKAANEANEPLPGAEYLDQDVEENGNFISSRYPADLPAFIKASLDKLK
ncbi:MAG: hypothetical protein ACXWMS_08805 [Syntrophales bacterium]